MKFLHLADLHLGRRLHDTSLLEDQQHILHQILKLLDQEGADAVLIAGDVYDKAVPSGEAVRLLDWFLTELVNRELPVLLVSGNHDSAERLDFGARLLRGRGLYVSALFDSPEEPIILHDRHGEVRCYLLPFVKPVHVRRVFPDAEIADYTQAVQTVIEAWKPDPQARNILLAHQLVTGGLRSESEALSIGGLDDVSGEILTGFDYVALGHLHRPQSVGKQIIRYAGSPLAYSFSEADQEKSVTWVQLEEKGNIKIWQTPLQPLHGVRMVKAPFSEVMTDSSEDYLRIILTDEEDVPNALSRLRSRYPNLLRLEYDNLRTRALGTVDAAAETLSPMELLEAFYAMRNGQPMADSQRQLARGWMEEIWEGRA